ncbi:MAG: Maf family protein [Candidatus Hydrogenedentes bacterium]|nr:Maf family protein [Candidatus Hydrogenedentota bacterium]
MKHFVLASASPRRRALLAALGLEFEVVPSDAAEVDEGSVPAAIVEANARAKRDEVAARLSRPAIVIAADTLVFLDEHVLSKPRDHDEACAMRQHAPGGHGSGAD